MDVMQACPLDKGTGSLVTTANGTSCRAVVGGAGVPAEAVV